MACPAIRLCQTTAPSPRNAEWGRRLLAVFCKTSAMSDSVRQRVIEAATGLAIVRIPRLGRLPCVAGEARPQTATIAYIHHGVDTGIDSAVPEFRGVRERAFDLGYTIRTRSTCVIIPLFPPSTGNFARGIQGVLVQAFRDNIHLDLEWSRFFTIFIGPENDLHPCP